MSKIPKVSVLLTVYNRSSVIVTINSILNQTYEDFELIIIDNASTDNTVDEIKKINDPRIKLFINDENRGQTYSLNRGLQLANGKYIARIDADDIAVPQRLEEQVAFMEANPECGVCGAWVQFITDDNKLTFVIKTCSTDEGLRIMQTIGCGMYHPAVMIRKSVLTDNGINYDSNLKMAEDYDMWRKILHYSKGHNIEKVLLYYRRGNNNDSKKNEYITKEEYFSVREKICEEEIDDILLKRKMQSIIQIEKKQKKTIYQTVRLLILYKQYLKAVISKDNTDYKLVRNQMFLRLHSSCIVYNTAIWGYVLKNIYNIFLKIMYKIKSK